MGVDGSTCFTGDVVVEILSRLPVKSLLRFLCVSNDWYGLIKSSYFTAIQLRNSDPNLSLHFKRTLDSEDSVTLFLNESKQVSLDLPFINCPSLQYSFPQGSSNGLICLSLFDLREEKLEYIVVWNPATKQFRLLPESSETDDHHIIGFEFFHDIRAYKVVGILQPGLDDTIRANVFTSSTNSWRQVQTSSCSLPAPGVTYEWYDIPSRITLNGVLYWPLWIQERRSHVLSFNLREEVFHVIPLPDILSPKTRLFSWKNSLAFLGGSEHELTREIWMMTEEPSASTTQMPWVKQFILELSTLPKYMLGSWKAGCLLGKDSNGFLHCYDPASQKSTKLAQHDQTDGSNYYKAINYVESLVSVD